MKFRAKSEIKGKDMTEVGTAALNGYFICPGCSKYPVFGMFIIVVMLMFDLKRQMLFFVVVVFAFCSLLDLCYVCSVSGEEAEESERAEPLKKINLEDDWTDLLSVKWTNQISSLPGE